MLQNTKRTDPERNYDFLQFGIFNFCCQPKAQIIKGNSKNDQFWTFFRVILWKINVCIKYTVSNWRILNHGFWNVCQVHLINWNNKLCQNFKFIQKNRKILSSNLIEGLKLTDGISILSKNDSAGRAGCPPPRPGRCKT